MKRFFWPIIFILCFLCSCSEKDAFDSGKLEFESAIKMEQGALVVVGETNLPDGFVLFVQTQQAPSYSGEATWAGQTRVNKNSFFFETIFTQKLPYKVKIIISPMLNPDFEKQLSGPDLPFAVDSTWEVTNLANGQLQLSRTIEKSFGTFAEHQALLTPALDAMGKRLEGLGKEKEILDGMIKNPAYGMARFARLHESKEKKWKRDSFNACSFFPYICNDLDDLAKSVEKYHRYVVATWEKDDKEKARQEKARERFENELEKFSKNLEKIQNLLKETAGEKQS